ncbi:MAG TPA: hypothetical protein VHC90_20035 [Bryobacteraceae bacterium]|nr:hypothetical protein [Bryobacteraceae bacterium]
MTVTITLTVDEKLVADVDAHWLQQIGASFGRTSAAIDSASGTITVTVDQSQLSQALALPEAGGSILIDGEPMQVTARNGSDLTLTRGGLPLATLGAHASGAAIYPLAYPDPWQMMGVEAFLPRLIAIAQERGPKSATFAMTISGTVAA